MCTLYIELFKNKILYIQRNLFLYIVFFHKDVIIFYSALVLVSEWYV